MKEMATETRLYSLKRDFGKKSSFLSLALAFLLLGLFFFMAHREGGWKGLKGVNFAFVLLAFASQYLSYLLRGQRWKKILEGHGYQGDFWALTKVIFLYQFIDNLLPFKIGDLYGAHLMKINHSMSRALSLGSIVFCRLVDSAFIVLILAVSLLSLFPGAIPKPFLLSLKAGVAIFLLLASVALISFFHRWLLPAFIPQRLRTLMEAFQWGFRPQWTALPSLFFLTLLIWFLEIGRVFMVFKAFSLEADIAVASVGSLSATLTSAFPLTPSGAGAVELVMAKVLALLKVEGALAYSITLMDRGINYWCQLLLGGLLLTFSRRFNIKVLTS